MSQEISDLTISSDHRIRYVREDDTEVIINVSDAMIMIKISGYGEKTAPNGMGSPVVVDFFENDPIVYIWADIGQEYPTHVASLALAREDLRNEKD